MLWVAQILGSVVGRTRMGAARCLWLGVATVGRQTESSGVRGNLSTIDRIYRVNIHQHHLSRCAQLVVKDFRTMSGAGDSREGISAWAETLEEDEGLVTCIQHADVEDSPDSIKPSAIVEKINRRYDRCNGVTSFYVDDDGWCASYAYYSEGQQIPSLESHNRIKYIQRKQPMFESCIKSRWMEMKENEKNKLYMILCAANMIWKRIHFNVNSEEWVLRSCKPRPSDVHSSLTHYGKSTEKGNFVLDILANGRSKENISKTIKDLKQESLGYQRLEDTWELALTSGMQTSCGRVAVYQLLDMIAGLLSGFDATYPKVAIIDNSAPYANDAFSITSSNSSKLQKRSAVNPQPAKRRKVDDSESDSSCDSDVEVSPTSKAEAEKRSKRKTWPKHNRQFGDLRVVSVDVSGVAKQLIVVEIHSKGKTLPQAQKMFTRELVHVLQFQNQVFGLLFGETVVLLYKAERNTLDTVNISCQTYFLVEGPNCDFETFCVAKFQKLVMDIISCLLHGMKYVDA